MYLKVLPKQRFVIRVKQVKVVASPQGINKNQTTTVMCIKLMCIKHYLCARHYVKPFGWIFSAIPSKHCIWALQLIPILHMSKLR